MTEKRFTVHKTIGMFHCFYVNDDLRDKVVMDNIIHKYEANRLCDKLNELHEENEQLREHFIYLIGTALEDKECRKIYAKGLIEIFDDCANLDEAKIKIKEYLDD